MKNNNPKNGFTQMQQREHNSMSFWVMTIYWTYHQLVGDLGDDHAEGKQVETGVVLEQLAGWLLEDDEGQCEDEADVETRSQHAGVLNRENVIKHASQ